MHSPAECTIPGCDRQVVGRGWCTSHYNRWQKYGTPTPDHLPELIGRSTTSYKRMHARRSERDPASNRKCVDCGAQAAEWSYEYGCPDERQSKWGPYCPHDDHYAPRCIPCHTAQATPHGESHYKATLTEAIVREIRALDKAGVTQADITRLYGLSRSQVHKIVSYLSWKHVV